MDRCEVCGKEYRRHTPWQKYCSKLCKSRHYNSTIKKHYEPRTCEWCKSKYKPRTYNQKYCSHLCRDRAAYDRLVNDPVRYRKQLEYYREYNKYLARKGNKDV